MEKVQIAFYADKRLRDYLSDLAEQEDICLSDYVVRLVANAAGRPDLATVPRKPLGRKRRELTASA